MSTTMIEERWAREGEPTCPACEEHPGWSDPHSREYPLDLCFECLGTGVDFETRSRMEAEDLADELNHYDGFTPWEDVIRHHPALDYAAMSACVIRGTQAETYLVPCRGRFTVQRMHYQDRWRVYGPAN